ncbi:MAG: DUF2169 domain-containing protein [Chloroflexota bacterium]|nr:DUF2169 domain-containing protein [Chloroflexota bacterium]
MLQIINETPFQVERSVQLDKQGNQIWVVIIKATYQIRDNDSVELHVDQEPVCLTPLYLGQPGNSSLVRECEMVAEHPGTDIVLNASAHAPQDHPISELDVGITVGNNMRKMLKVFGERFWKAGIFSPKISAPESFKMMPIVYERAYGGRRVFEDGRMESESRNPVGRGFVTHKNDLVHKPLPNVEDPEHLIHSWNDRPTPAGLGAIASSWTPRQTYAGTFDEQWANWRMPLWPDDYDPQYQQSAHPDLISQQPLHGGESVVLLNLTPESQLSFRLPRVFLNVVTQFAGAQTHQPLQMDRVIIEPDEHKLILIWRSTLNCRAQVRKVEKSVVSLKEAVKL